MVQSLKVILWGEEIGRLAWDTRRRLSCFMYNPAFLKKGLNISPLAAPVDGARGLTPVWGEEAKIYQKLPAFLADSLPDAWGNQLFELWRQQNHLSNAGITPLDKLSFIGKRGMGALEFLPEVSRERKAEKIDIKSLAILARRIFSERENIIGGSLRLLFSFPAGLLLSRVFKPVKVRGAFWIGSFSIVVLSAIPRIGGSEHLWMNGLYDTICFAVVFPLLVCLGASGKTTDKVTTRVCRFLGDISYPLYMVHYPFIYLYYAWVKNENLTFIQSLPGAVALVAGSVVLAYLCLKLYDEPVRRFLSRRLRIN